MHYYNEVSKKINAEENNGKLEKIYVLDCAMMNGTVRMNSNYTGYASKELAEEAAEEDEKQ